MNSNAAPIKAGDAAVDLTQELVGIDSVNPGLVPGSAGEGRIVDLLSARLAARGFVIERVEAEGADREPRPSLIATHWQRRRTKRCPQRAPRHGRS